jgi:hypothetical protein
MVGVIKLGSTSGEAMAAGAAGGTMVGLLATLFAERPSLKKAVRNAVIGGAGGAMIGGGVNALGGASTKRQVAPANQAPSAPPKDPGKMSLGLAALSGIVPGVGPALHGGVSQGLGQAAASGGASLAGAMGVLYPYRNADLANIPKGISRKAMLASAIGALGAGYIGNSMREGAA